MKGLMRLVSILMLIGSVVSVVAGVFLFSGTSAETAMGAASIGSGLLLAGVATAGWILQEMAEDVARQVKLALLGFDLTRMVGALGAITAAEVPEQGRLGRAKAKVKIGDFEWHAVADAARQEPWLAEAKAVGSRVQVVGAGSDRLGRHVVVSPAN